MHTRAVNGAVRSGIGEARSGCVLIKMKRHRRMIIKREESRFRVRLTVNLRRLHPLLCARNDSPGDDG